MIHISEEKSSGQLLSSVTTIFITKSLSAPIDMVRIRWQNANAMFQAGTITKPYAGIIDCIKRIYIQEGFRAYWKGNGVDLIKYFPSQAFAFAFRDYFNKLIPKGNREYSYILYSLAVGFASGAVASSLTYPLDYARTRLANDLHCQKYEGEKQFRGVFDLFRKTVTSQGFTGLYRGFVINSFSIVVYRGLYFGLYDFAKLVLNQPMKQNMIISFAVGWMTTLLSGILSYPIDTIKRRMMMSCCEPQRITSSFYCAKKIIKDEGIKCLFRGVSINILRAVSGAGMLTLYDNLNIFLTGSRDERTVSSKDF